MQNNSISSSYVIVDASTLTVYSGPMAFATASFLQRSFLDVLQVGVPNRQVNNLVKNPDFRIGASTYRAGVLTSIHETPVATEKVIRIGLMAAAYNFLLGYANYTVEGIWSTASVDVTSMPFAVAFPKEYAAEYAKSKGLDQAMAEKQIKFDIESIRTVALRRQSLIWNFEKEILNMRTQADFDAFKEKVKDDVVKRASL